MKSLQDFKIPYVGLKNGLHSFIYNIDRKFFSFFENSPIGDCDLQVEALLDKKEGFFNLQITINGSLFVECDRCSDTFPLPTNTVNEIIIKFESDDKTLDDEADVLYINRTETHIDIAQLIYEYTVLALPIQRIHPLDSKGKSTCNKEVLEYLEKLEDKNNNKPDERWAILEKLKKQK